MLFKVRHDWPLVAKYSNILSVYGLYCKVHSNYLTFNWSAVTLAAWQTNIQLSWKSVIYNNQNNSFKPIVQVYYSNDCEAELPKYLHKSLL